MHKKLLTVERPSTTVVRTTSCGQGKLTAKGETSNFQSHLVLLPMSDNEAEHLMSPTTPSTHHTHILDRGLRQRLLVQTHKVVFSPYANVDPVPHEGKCMSSKRTGRQTIRI